MIFGLDIRQLKKQPSSASCFASNHFSGAKSRPSIRRGESFFTSVVCGVVFVWLRSVSICKWQGDLGGSTGVENRGQGLLDLAADGSVYEGDLARSAAVAVLGTTYTASPAYAEAPVQDHEVAVVAVISVLGVATYGLAC